MRCIATVATKDGATLKVIEFTVQHNGLKHIELSILQATHELTRAFFATKQLNDWQTIVLTLERGS